MAAHVPPFVDWWSLLTAIDPAAWRVVVEDIVPTCAALRPPPKSKKPIGTMSLASCACLLALVEWLRPAHTVEVGTYIGTSTRVLRLRSGVVYTCDRDHDLVPSGQGIVPYPMTASTRMLTELRQSLAGAVDLFFFDGRLYECDLPLIAALSHKQTVYAFDDFEGREKGVVNLERLQMALPRHRLVSPVGTVPGQDGESTIALLVP